MCDIQDWTYEDPTPQLPTSQHQPLFHALLLVWKQSYIHDKWSIITSRAYHFPDRELRDLTIRDKAVEGKILLGIVADGSLNEVLVKRSAVSIMWSVANTIMRLMLAVDGTELIGAAGWANVWGMAALLTSIVDGEL
ncbi:hypothetical protein LTS10_011990 [Elasticomyces elasticus]|nr:hypothetical protein LTS10_011990 [Elasticomyces elasticus]